MLTTLYVTGVVNLVTSHQIVGKTIELLSQTDLIKLLKDILLAMIMT